MKNQSPNTTKGILTKLGPIAAALALTAAGCKKAEPPAPPPPPLVQVMEVAKKNVDLSTTFIGKLDSPQNVEIRARVESFLEKMLFVEGEEECQLKSFP